jgi:hypothetical protein
MAGRQAWASAWAWAAGLLVSAPAHADGRLTEPERVWTDAARPVLAEARRARLPLDIVVQPQPNAGEPPLAIAFIGERCKLVLTMRGPDGGPLEDARLDAALPAVLIEAMVAHELGHCWRHARGDWHAWPAGFDAPRPSSPAAVHAASQRAARPDRVEAARREEGFADLVALAWTLQRDPAAYAFVHGWLTAQRADPAHDGAEHDTRAWVRAARDPAAFGPPGPLFERARRLWAEVDPAQAH